MVRESDIRLTQLKMTAVAVFFNGVVRIASFLFSSIRDIDKSSDLAIYKPLNYIIIL